MPPVSVAPLRRQRIFWTVFLVAGIPILVILWTFLREVIDVGALDRQNPLHGLGVTALEKIHQRINTGQAQLAQVADGLLAGNVSLTDFSAYVDQGPFQALAQRDLSGLGQRYPATLTPDRGAALSGSALLDANGLFRLDDGTLVLPMVVPLADGQLVGLFDVAHVLGRGGLKRMRMARHGDVFLVGNDGHIFVSANPGLLGRHLDELGLGALTTGRWNDAAGVVQLTALVETPEWVKGPHQYWRLGLVMPEAVLHQRNRQVKIKVLLVAAAVVMISAALVLLLRRSVGGHRR